MLKSKELKGTVTNPNVDELINKFFQSCDENTNILNLFYSTSSVPYKTNNGTVGYQVVSSCLIFYNETEEESNE